MERGQRDIKGLGEYSGERTERHKGIRGIQWREDRET